MISGYRHEALMYRGDQQFARALTPFLSAGVAAAEPTLVVVAAPKIDALRRALGRDAARITFADMADVGANPANIIPAWEDFVRGGSGGASLRGVGEPITAQSEGHDLTERENHEALLNLAFADVAGFWLMCPYDTTAVDAAVVAEAHRNHAHISDETGHRESPAFQGGPAAARGLAKPLPEPTTEVTAASFERTSLRSLRQLLYATAARAGMTPKRMADLVLAVSEVANNSLRHGGGSGAVRLWLDGPCLVCEVRDTGLIVDALADRRRPRADPLAPSGLWLANQLCDLVQVRSRTGGTVVRLHQRLV
jgi:anti-sigma regulatory factor (Ser/Thr protein kinase)